MAHPSHLTSLTGHGGPLLFQIRWRQGSRSVRTCVDSMGFSEAKERGPGREEMACRLLGPWGWRQLLEAEAGAVGRYTGVGGKDRIRRPGEAGRRRRVGWWRRPSVCFFFFLVCALGWFGSFAPARGLRRCVRVRCAVATVPSCAVRPRTAALRRWRGRQVGFRRARWRWLARRCRRPLQCKDLTRPMADGRKRQSRLVMCGVE